MAQGLYNHSTVPLTPEEKELQELQEKASASSEWVSKKKSELHLLGVLFKCKNKPEAINSYRSSQPCSYAVLGLIDIYSI